MPVYYAFIVSVVMNFIGVFARLAILKRENGFPVIAFMKNAVLPLIPIAVVTFLIPYILLVNLSDSIPNIVVSTLAGEFALFVLIWLIGLNKQEKEFVVSKVSKLRRKI
jgi:hypothetical protein